MSVRTPADFLIAGLGVAVFCSIGTKVQYMLIAKKLIPVSVCLDQYIIGAMCLLSFWMFLMPRSARKVPTAPPKMIPGKNTSVFKKGQHWTCDATKEAPINFPPEGSMSKEKLPPTTMIHMLKRAVEKSGDKVALAIERPCPEEVSKNNAPSLPWNKWSKWTWKDVLTESEYIAAGLIGHGLQMFGSVAVWGYNSPEWHCSAYAAAIAGAKTAGIYPTDSRENLIYKIKQSSAMAVVVEGMKQLDVVKSQISQLPEVKVLVVYDPEVYNGPNFKEETLGNGVKVISWKTLMAEGKADTAALSELRNNRYKNTKPGHCCDLVYTSGTTGMPKAVMLSHDNVFATMSNVPAIAENDEDPTGPGFLSGEQRIISYLPLSHVAGFVVDVILPVVLSARLDHFKHISNCTVYYARKYDLSSSTIKDRLQFVRPTVFLGVPRVWEKVAEAVKAVGVKAPAPLKAISNWAKAKVLHHSNNCQIGGNGAYPVQYALAKFITGRVRKTLGMDQIRLAFSGAAPIMPETVDYWSSLGIDIYEIFGMSESCGITTVNSGYGRKRGSIGYSASGMEVACLDTMSGSKDPERIQPVSMANFSKPTEKEQGELCFRGRSIMMGYLANPKMGKAHVAEIEKKTAEAIDENGWLKSGDKGCMDATGMFRVTGRYKELIITAGGENIAPVPIEDWVKSNFTCISNLMMVGDKKKYNTCLISLKCVGASGQDPGTTTLIKSVQAELGVTTIEEARKSPKVKEYLEGALKAVNANQEVCANNASKIQKYYLLPIDFSVSGEEFTPTLKLKRNVVMEKYEKEISSMY